MTAAAESVRRIESERLVAIVRVSDASAAATSVQALIAGGVSICEISLATPGAVDAISAVAASADGALIGAGTVTSVELAEQAVAAGASYLVAPTLNHEVAAWAGERDLFYLPGAFTPAEIEAAAAVAPLVKLFPAARLGPAYVSDVRAPFPNLRLVPTGGITRENAGAFIRAGAVAVAVGSSLVDDASARDPDGLAVAARTLRETLNPSEEEEQ